MGVDGPAQGAAARLAPRMGRNTKAAADRSRPDAPTSDGTIQGLRCVSGGPGESQPNLAEQGNTHARLLAGARQGGGKFSLRGGEREHRDDLPVLQPRRP